MKINKLKGVEPEEACASGVSSQEHQDTPKLTQFSPGAG